MHILNALLNRAQGQLVRATLAITKGTTTNQGKLALATTYRKRRATRNHCLYNLRVWQLLNGARLTPTPVTLLPARHSRY